MSLPTYESYEESGFDWLGNLPAHWEVRRLKYLIECLDGQRVPLNSVERAERPGNIPYWGANCIMGYVDKSLFDEDLVLLGEDGAPFFDPLRPVAFFSQGPVWPNNHVHVLRPRCGVQPRFLTAALNATDYAEFIDGSTRDKLTQGAMMSIPVAWPPHEERDRVVAFLDQETGKIDGLIEQQRRLIELLNEKSQAVISHAITCLTSNGGGDESTQYDDKLGRHIKSIEQGWSPQAEDRSPEEGEAAVLKLSAVKAGRFFGAQVKALPSSVTVPSALLLRNDDFLLTRANTPELVGDTCVVDDAPLATMFSDLIYRLTLETSLLPSYLNLLMQSHLGRSLAKRDARGSSQSMVKLGHDHIRNWSIPVPPISEQQRIVRVLEAEREKLSALVDEAEAAIALLIERRAALISAAVRGHIDVRNYVPRETSAPEEAYELA